MKESVSYNKNATELDKKIKNLHVPEDAFLVPADVLGLYPNILYERGFEIV